MTTPYQLVLNNSMTNTLTANQLPHLIDGINLYLIIQ